MPKCSICGKVVRSGEVLHVKCREKWQAEVYKELESGAAINRERERVLDEREEMMRKREENVLDREEELEIREEAAEIQLQILNGVIEEGENFTKKARWLFFFNAGMAVWWVCWSLIKIVA